jgi:N-methylhydantoinase A
VPPHSGVFSAWGMLVADLRHDLGQTYIAPLRTADVRELNATFASLEAKVRDVFAKENVEKKQIAMSYQVDMRYVGQEHTLAVGASCPVAEAAKATLAAAFDETHLRVYGHNAPEEEKEIVSLKVIGIGSVNKPVLEKIQKGAKTPPADARMGERPVYVGNGRHQSFAIYRRERLLAGNAIDGPALVEEVTATTVVEPKQTCRVDEYGTLIISVHEEER